LYFSVSNVLATQNVLQGVMPRIQTVLEFTTVEKLLPQQIVFFFCRFLWTISNDKKRQSIKEFIKVQSGKDTKVQRLVQLQLYYFEP
jgi:hypothetical protein